MKYFITGGAGFIGSNLSKRVLQSNDDLIVLDNLSRTGSSQNLEALKSLGEFKFYNVDIVDTAAVEGIIRAERPDVIFHLAGQVAMTTSIANPRLDFEINAVGTLNILEAVRTIDTSIKIIYSSTNKVYGDFSGLKFNEEEFRYVSVDYPNGFSEDHKLSFHSPYGCSKGAADQYLLDYARMFDLNTLVFRHSSMYGGFQNATIDQGWLGWFCKKALDQRYNFDHSEFTISGNGKQVRDLLHSDDVVDLYFLAIEQFSLLKGKAFNIGGGIQNSMSILELFNFLNETLDIQLSYSKLPFRQSDQLVFVADNTRITNLLGWVPKVDSKRGISLLLQELSKSYE